MATSPRTLLKQSLRPVRSLARALGYDVVKLTRAPMFPPDLSQEDIDTYLAVRQFTMTPPEAIHAVCEAVRYIVRHRLPGAVVECGVWRGGSAMAAVRTLLRLGVTDRDVFLFDTFEGMTPPTTHDVDFRGASAAHLMSEAQREGRPDTESLIWAYSSLEQTKRAVLGVGYPSDRIHFVKGRVEETIPKHAPDPIALLRLDTDWYESTRHELTHLFPRLVPGGVIIIDDYGHWKGARQATDEYLAQNNVQLFLGRINYTGRIAIKR